MKNFCISILLGSDMINIISISKYILTELCMIQIVDHKNDKPIYQPQISPILIPFQKKSSLCSDFFSKVVK